MCGSKMVVVGMETLPRHYQTRAINALSVNIGLEW